MNVRLMEPTEVRESPSDQESTWLDIKLSGNEHFLLERGRSFGFKDKAGNKYLLIMVR